MLLKVHSASLAGIRAEILDIEVDLSSNHKFVYQVVGLPDTAVRESGDRVRAATRNCGYPFPFSGTVTVNLAPADFKKEGSGYDLPIALAILGISGELTPEAVQPWLIMGELSLDGRVRPIRGALPVAMSARKAGFTKLLLPADNAREAGVVEGLEVYPAHSLPQVVHLLNGGEAEPVKVSREELYQASNRPLPDLRDVKGQQAARRALEVACAGGHNILMIGPPGSGKTMLAKRIPSILPEMSFAEALETTAVHSVCGFLSSGSQQFVAHRPFRAPHHTISGPGLVGGGTLPRPGEVSLAHNGVLFLDELTEFHRSVLEVLRQPLEDRRITISRALRSLTFPASFMLAAAMNPCPCGYWNSVVKDCLCTPLQIQRYISKISGPLLDRIDLHIDVPEVNYKELTGRADGEPSEAVAARVRAARRIQEERFASLHSHPGEEAISTGDAPFEGATDSPSNAERNGPDSCSESESPYPQPSSNGRSSRARGNGSRQPGTGRVGSASRTPPSNDRTGSKENADFLHSSHRKIFCNAQMTERLIEKHCRLDASCKRILERAIEELGFSARAYNRILKVSRTIADLAGSEKIRPQHVSEAIQYRSLDRSTWGP